MQNRILQLLTAENISQTEFARKIGVSGPNVTHIISGRNKPSYDFIFRVASAYPALNLEWLLFGKGKMYKDKNPEPPVEPVQQYAPDGTLFTFDENIEATPAQTPPQVEVKPTENQRKAIRVTVFYDDGTFQDL